MTMNVWDVFWRYTQVGCFTFLMCCQYNITERKASWSNVICISALVCDNLWLSTFTFAKIAPPLFLLETSQVFPIPSTLSCCWSIERLINEQRLFCKLEAIRTYEPKYMQISEHLWKNSGLLRKHPWHSYRYLFHHIHKKIDIIQLTPSSVSCLLHDKDTWWSANMVSYTTWMILIFDDSGLIEHAVTIRRVPCIASSRNHIQMH